MSIQKELERLKSLIEERGYSVEIREEFSESEVLELEEKLGIRLDEDLKYLLQRTIYIDSNSSYYSSFNAGRVATDYIAVVDFLNLNDIKKEVKGYYDIHIQNYEPEIVDEYDFVDERVNPYEFHIYWLPLAEFNGFSTAVYYDTDPSDKGSYGQIIAFQHDPDSMYFVAENIVDFLKISNDRIEMENKGYRFVKPFIEKLAAFNLNELIDKGFFEQINLEELMPLFEDKIKGNQDLIKVFNETNIYIEDNGEYKISLYTNKLDLDIRTDLKKVYLNSYKLFN